MFCPGSSLASSPGGRVAFSCRFHLVQRVPRHLWGFSGRPHAYASTQTPHILRVCSHCWPLTPETANGWSHLSNENARQGDGERIQTTGGRAGHAGIERSACRWTCWDRGVLSSLSWGRSMSFWRWSLSNSASWLLLQAGE